MTKTVKTTLISLFMAVMILVGVLCFSPIKAEASSIDGLLINTAIDMELDTEYRKGWSKDNYNDNHWNKFVVPKDGYVTFTGTKPYDDSGEYFQLQYLFYDEDANPVYSQSTFNAVDNPKAYYKFSFGLKAGTYYLNTVPDFRVTSGVVTTNYSISFTAAKNYEKEGNETKEQATEMELGKYYKAHFGADGYFNFGLYDYWKVPCVKGHTYRIKSSDFSKLSATSTGVYITTPDVSSKWINYDLERNIDSSGANYYNVTASSNGYIYVYLYNYAGEQFEYNIRIDDTTPRPAAPTVKATNVASSGKIKLTWNKVNGAVKYNVYRSTAKNGTYSIVKTATGTSYTNTNAKAGTNYYYYVTAVNSKNMESKASTKVNRTCDLPYTTVTLKNVADSGKIKLTWTKVEGAVKYEVYRCTTKSGTYKLQKSTTALNWTDTNTTAGKTYYYKVKALHTKSAADSAFSVVESGMCDLKRPVVKITSSSGKPKLSWAAVTGAKEYKIYRSTSKSGTYSAVKTTTANYWKDTTAKKGKTYYYKVVAIHKNSDAKSAGSVVVSQKCTK